MNSNTIKRLVPTSNERLVDKQTTSHWNTAKLIKSSLTPLFMKLRDYFSILFLVFSVLCWATSSLAAMPAIFYSDLTNGPKNTGQNDKGAFVTIWGDNFGATRSSSYVTVGEGQVDNYPVWTATKITLQLGGNANSGNIVVHTAEGTSSENIPFTINNGHVYFATNADVVGGNGSYTNPWTHAKSFYEQANPGDILYLRGGNYTGQYGNSFMGASYQIMTGIAGTENAYIGWAAYPGEAVTFTWGKGRHFQFRDKSSFDSANYQFVSQITMDGNGSSSPGGVGAGGWYLNEEEGAHHLRVVGCRITNAAKGAGTTMTGHVRFTNDGSKFLGNEIDNCGVKGNAFNNNHLIYVQCGADDIEIAYNNIHDNAAGHWLQIHADNAPYTYDNILVHSNYITTDNPTDMRGMTVSNVLPATTVYFYNNIVKNIGWYSGFNLVKGNAYVYNNTFYSVGGNGVISLMSNNGQHIYLKNNIIWSDGNTPYVYFGTYDTEYPTWSNVTIDANLYFNRGTSPSQDANAITSDPLLVKPDTGNYRILATSPARNNGTSTVAEIVKIDKSRLQRPNEGSYDIGAYEFYSDSSSTLMSPVIIDIKIQ